MKYIYGLIDPRDRTFGYVGQSNDLDRRHVEHIESEEDTTKGRWVDSMRRDGVYPEMVELERVADDSQANYREKCWINLGRQLGWPLTNTGNPSRTGDSFPEMFNESLRAEYAVFAQALLDKDPLVIVTRRQFEAMLFMSKLVLALVIGVAIAWGVGWFEYGVRADMGMSIWVGSTTGLALTIMLGMATVREFKKSWWVYVYCGFYLLVGLIHLF